MNVLNFETVLTAVIERGLAAVYVDYAKHPDKLHGATLGFNDCRNLDAGDLATILADARVKTHQAHLEENPRYWEMRCREAEIEWVCNCMGAYLGRPIGNVPVTVRGVINIHTVIKEICKS